MHDDPRPKKSFLLSLFDEEERSYLQRLKSMCHGLRAEKDSLAHKEAIKEAQRLAAPLIAILLPLGVICLMCSISLNQRTSTAPIIETIVVEPEAAPEQLDETPEPPTVTDSPEEIISDVIVDVPSPPLGTPTTDPVSTTPPVQMISSPIKMTGIPTRGSGGEGLGGGTQLEGDMVGMFIDLSRDATGKERKANLYADVHNILAKGCTKEAFAPYNIVPQRVYLSHLVLPRTKSSLGPITFKVDKHVKKGSAWIAVYKGWLQPEVAATYRFVGLYDDVMCIRVNGKTVFEFAWDSRNASVGSQTALKSGWTLKDATVTGKYTTSGYEGTPLCYGDWFSLSPKQRVPVEIIIGDNGGNAQSDGGKTGGVLLIEEQGKTYAKTANGYPLLPPFSTTRLTFPERQRLETICDPKNTAGTGKYTFTLQEIPIMDTCGKSVESMFKDDISIDTGEL